MSVPLNTNPLAMIRNVAAQFLIDVNLPAGQTLAGKDLIFTVKLNTTLPDSTHIFQKSSPSGGITITGETTAEMDLTASDTASLLNHTEQNLVYTLVLVDGPNNYPIGFESFTVTANPTEVVLS